jgi:hypothetical protein
MSTTTKNTQATKTVSQGESRYGTPEPQIALRFPKGTSYRVVKAALHKLAAEIELATPASERWCVNTEDFNESGRVYLELADAMPAEAARGIAVLRKLLGEHASSRRIVERLFEPTVAPRIDGVAVIWRIYDEGDHSGTSPAARPRRSRPIFVRSRATRPTRSWPRSRRHSATPRA